MGIRSSKNFLIQLFLIFVFSLSPFSYLISGNLDHDYGFSISISPNIVWGQTTDDLNQDSADAQKAITFTERNETLESFCSGNPGTWFTNCIIERLLNVSNRFLVFSGAVFDYFLWFTLDNEILDSEVVQEGWEDMRDIANLAFILGLIYISFTLILGIGSSGAKKFFIRLVTIGIVLNFSLFATQVLIDAGNITALTFYKEIKVVDPNPSIPTDGLFAPKNVELNSVSGALVQSFNPARIVDSKVFNSITNSSTGAAGNSAVWGLVFLLYLAFTIINVMGAWQIIKASFTFISRTIWLIILSIVSPLAFVLFFLPNGEKWFRKWFTNLFDRCFCIVVYLFFIWLLILLLEGANGALNTASVAGQTSWKVVLLSVVIQFTIVYSVLKIAGDQAKKMCEGGRGVGDFVAGAAKKAVGVGVGVATGGAGLASRRVIGKYGYEAVEGNNALGRRLGAMVQSDNGVTRFMGNVGLGAADKFQAQKFGLSDGYKGAADKIADRDVKVANRVGNVVKKVNKGAAQDSYERQYLKDGYTPEGAEAKAKAEVKKRESTYKKEGIEAGRGYLEGRTKGATGAMVSVLNGLVPDGATEAVRRYGSKEKEAADKLEKQNVLSNFANAITALYAQQGTDMQRSVVVAANETREKIKQGATTDDIVKTGSVKAVQDKAEDIIKPSRINQEEGKLEALRHTKITENTNEQAKSTFKETIDDAVAAQRKADDYKKEFTAVGEMVDVLRSNSNDQTKVLETLASMGDKLEKFGMKEQKQTLMQKFDSITQGSVTPSASIKDLDLDAISDAYEIAVTNKAELAEAQAEQLTDQAFEGISQTTSKALQGKSAMARNMAQAQYRSVSDESAKAQEILGDDLATARDQFADDADTGVSGT